MFPTPAFVTVVLAFIAAHWVAFGVWFGFGETVIGLLSVALSRLGYPKLARQIAALAHLAVQFVAWYAKARGLPAPFALAPVAPTMPQPSNPSGR